MNKKILCLILLLCIMTGCNVDERPDSSKESSTIASTTSHIAASEATTAAMQTTTAPPATSEVIIEPDQVIPPAIQTPRAEGNRLLYTIMNVYSDGNYYTVDISGVRLDSTAEAGLDTTYVMGELYGDFRLDLKKNNDIIDTLKINVPRDDRFLILESVTDNLSYGCELISNRRQFSANEYPDLIQLDFHIIDEPETPQYARFFSIFNGKIIEIPVLEDGAETAPYGTHLETESAGIMTQHIVASRYDGSYTVIKYEYTFDIKNRCLNRQQVKFYG